MIATSDGTIVLEGAIDLSKRAEYDGGGIRLYMHCFTILFAHIVSWCGRSNG